MRIRSPSPPKYLVQNTKWTVVCHENSHIFLINRNIVTLLTFGAVFALFDSLPSRYRLTTL